MDTTDRPEVTRTYQLMTKQATDLINNGFLTPGECVELHMSVGLGVALSFSEREDITAHLRQLADEIDAGADLRTAH